MSRQRRNFSAKFKSDLVIELLKGEKDLNTLATENNIQPNLLRNWKKEFLNNASAVFDDKRQENLKDNVFSFCDLTLTPLQFLYTLHCCVLIYISRFHQAANTMRLQFVFL